MKIMCIDGDRESVDAFITTLQKAGHEVLYSADGTTALDKVKAAKPNLILLGQMLPDMKGNEVLKLLKNDAETKQIPLAILSNFGQQEIMEEAITLGANDYFLKYQIAPADLVSKVETLGKAPVEPGLPDR